MEHLKFLELSDAVDCSTNKRKWPVSEFLDDQVKILFSPKWKI